MKTCPFCGKPAVLRERLGWFGIGCEASKCPAALHALVFRTAGEALSAWNHRAVGAQDHAPCRDTLAGCAPECGEHNRCRDPGLRPLGCALAMRVLQSELYRGLNDAERADCDELVQRNLEWFKRDSAPGVLWQGLRSPHG
jgi:hypothetical protein